jgi:hypothetical protein
VLVVGLLVFVMSIRLSGNGGAYGPALDRADGDIGEQECQKAQPERN